MQQMQGGWESLPNRLAIDGVATISAAPPSHDRTQDTKLLGAWRFLYAML